MPALFSPCDFSHMFIMLRGDAGELSHVLHFVPFAEMKGRIPKLNVVSKIEFLLALYNVRGNYTTVWCNHGAPCRLGLHMHQMNPSYFALCFDIFYFKKMHN